MTTELTILVYAALLQVAQFLVYSVAANLQLGVKITAGPRDSMPEITGVTGRLQRAFNNHFEALVLFSIAVAAVTLADKSTSVTQLCAFVYIIARILYIPAYLSGIFMLRSIIWFFGLGATSVMLVSVLL